MGQSGKLLIFSIPSIFFITPFKNLGFQVRTIQPQPETCDQPTTLKTFIFTHFANNF